MCGAEKEVFRCGEEISLPVPRLDCNMQSCVNLIGFLGAEQGTSWSPDTYQLWNNSKLDPQKSIKEHLEGIIM